MTRLVLVAVLVIGSAARLVWLDRLPGIDGDEAWYGVNVQVFRDGGVPFLRTGVGNALNPFHSLPLLGLSYVMPVGGALLRMPEVIWGILAVLLAYPLMSRAVGGRAAALISALLALSPTATAYSRFGWDPSGTPLACLLAIAFAWRQQPAAAALSSVAAMMIHPTNVFVVPIVTSLFGPRVYRWYRSTTPALKRQLRIGAAIAVAIGIPAALWMLKTLARRPNTSIPSIEIVTGRALSPGAWFDTATGVVRLFSGISAVADIAGAPPALSTVVLDVVAAMVLLVPLVLALRTLVSAHEGRGAWMAAGVLTSLAAFHIVAGPTALGSGRERYGMVFLVPAIVLAAVAIDALSPTRPAVARTATALAAISFAALTLGGYFMPLLAHGGHARAGLRTGTVEPKVAAFDFLSADAPSADAIEVIAEDWYLYWPMRYLAGQDKRFRVELIEGANAPGGLRPAGVPPEPYPRTPERVYALVFADGGEWRRLTGLGLTPAFTAGDPVGRPILHVFRVR